MKTQKSKLATIRKQSGMTQEELAQKVGISRTYLTNLESGRYTPSLEVAKNLSAIFNVSIDDLFL
jgi:putative transcriptional regulator